MALPGINQFPPSAAAALIFKRLPDKLFGPLASVNRHRYWMLLCDLHHQRFGPEAPMPPSQGFSMREIISDIEQTLSLQDAWESEEGDTPESTINQRATNLFNRLNDCGWLKVERHGVMKRVLMPDAVSQFLGQLITFAETGPVFVAGKIRSISVNLQLIINKEGEGDSLTETAEQVRNLLEHIRNTGTSVRDLMESISAETTTAQYVQRFFNDYIEKVFIGDYRDLRTKDHPLSRKLQILGMIDDIYNSEESRTRLISWYETKHCGGDKEKALRIFERNIQRLYELEKINDYLNRLDDEIRRANKRALAFLDYRLRSMRSVDHLVRKAIARATSGKAPGYMPFAPGELIGAERLASPRKHIDRASAPAFRRAVASDADIARSNCMLRAITARSIDKTKLNSFVFNQLEEQGELTSSGIQLSTVADICAYQTLHYVGLAYSSESLQLKQEARGLTVGFDVEITDSEEEPNDFISGRPFRIIRRKKHKAVKENR